MGANWSVDGSYTLGEQLNFENKLWKIYPAESRSDSVSATVFIHGKEKDENIYGVDKAVKVCVENKNRKFSLYIYINILLNNDCYIVSYYQSSVTLA